MKKILLVGASSKIAQHISDKLDDTYEVFGTYTSNDFPKREDTHHYFKLDLTDTKQVSSVISRLAKHSFAGVCILSSTYTQDPESLDAYFAQAERDLRVNTLAPLAICRALRYDPTATVFLFGDNGLDAPKPNFTTYSIAKSLLHSLGKILAVELAEKARVVTFKLGPTLAPTGSTNKEQYYNRTLYRVDNPVEGLVSYIHFILNEKNLSMTAAEIPYDGGTYAKR